MTKPGRFRHFLATRICASITALASIVGCAESLAAPPRSATSRHAADATPAQCRLPNEVAFVEGALPRLARRLDTPPVPVVVIGSGSSAGSGVSNRQASFPLRLEARLAQAFPRAKVSVTVLAQTGQTAPAMLARLEHEVVKLHPALVIWQTGSADAARGVAPVEFGIALDRGVALLLDKGADVLLVDSQFSPRAALLVNTEAYREALRWNARRYGIPLFRRYDTMQYWWSNEVFDLDTEDKALQLANADRIHDCVAALLLKLIESGVAEAKRR